MRPAALLLLATALALVIPCSGPVLDHHLAGRYGDRPHIHLGCVSLKHIQPYEVTPTHAGRAPTDSYVAGPSAAGPPSNGAVCLASHDALGQVMAQLTVPAMHVTLNFPDLEDRHSTFIVPGDGVSLQDVFLASAKKPPRL